MGNEKDKVLGIDIGGTYMRFGLVDRKYEVRCFERLSTLSVFAQEKDPAASLMACIQDYCEKNLQGKFPAAVSIGFPSPISKDRKVVVQAPNIPCIPVNFPVVKMLEKGLGTPVFINRDVNYLFLFDQQDLSLKEKSCVIAVYFGTGIGNAILIDGKLLLGSHSIAAELGHVPLYGNDRVCGCKNKGCIETLFSGRALERIQREEFPQTPIGKVFLLHRDSLSMRRFIEGMAEAVAIEVNLLDPDCIILGGGVLQMEGFPKELMETFIHEHICKPYPEMELDIRYSRAAEDNGIVGAGIYAYQCLAKLAQQKIKKEGDGSSDETSNWE